MALTSHTTINVTKSPCLLFIVTVSQNSFWLNDLDSVAFILATIPGIHHGQLKDRLPKLKINASSTFSISLVFLIFFFPFLSLHFK